jgi:hypothetical protein
MESECSIPYSQQHVTGPYPNMLSKFEALFNIFKHAVMYVGEVLRSAQPPKLEDHSLSAVRDYLFNINKDICTHNKRIIFDLRFSQR